RTVPSPRAVGGYKLFVAWRYLLVTRRKIRPLTQRLLFGGITALGLLPLLHVLHLEPDTTALHIAVTIAAIAVGLFTALVVFLGVLPHAKPALIVALVRVAVYVPALAVYLLVTYARPPFVHLN